MLTALVLLVLVVAVAGLVLTWSLRGRLEAQERKLEELAGLSFLPDRVQALAREVEAQDLDLVMKELEAVHQALDRLEGGIAVLEPAEPRELPRPQVVRALVTRFLREEGFHAVVIDNADEELEAPRLDVRVHATREGATWRGQVTVDDEQVVDRRLEASFTAFP